MTGSWISRGDLRVYSFRGPDRLAFLQGQVSNDVLKMAPGESRLCCVLTTKGRLRADVELYERGEETLAVLSAAAVAGFEEAFAKVILLSETKIEALEDWTIAFLAGTMPPSSGELVIVPHHRLCPDGLLLLAPPGLDVGRLLGDRPQMAREEFEALRIEAGVPAFGVDMDGESLPQEVRLDDAVSYNKGCYLGQETMSRLHHLGHVNRRLVRLKVEGTRVPERGTAVLSGEREVGRVTSAAYSGKLGMVVVLAMVAANDAAGVPLRLPDGAYADSF